MGRKINNKTNSVYLMYIALLLKLRRKNRCVSFSHREIKKGTEHVFNNLYCRKKNTILFPISIVVFFCLKMIFTFTMYA